MGEVPLGSRRPSPERGHGEWETAQTIFHDVVVFGMLAERAMGVLHTGDPVIAHGEFRFREYDDSSGNARVGTSFVATRLGPDILLSDVTVVRREGRELESAQRRVVAAEAERETHAPPPAPQRGLDATPPAPAL